MSLPVSAFDFHLPPELVAQPPPAERGTSRLMRLERASGQISHRRFAELPELLRPGDLLVSNDTKVFPARLLGERPGGGAVECLLVAPQSPAGADAPGAPSTWEALIKPSTRVRAGMVLRFARAGAVLSGEVLDARAGDRRLVRLWSEGGDTVAGAIDRIGHVPLPPYIRRADVAADRERYQTVFARHQGSIAAPTAGLHFTPGILRRLDDAGVERATITLHVGYGTFQPVRVDLVQDHRMEAERYEVSASTAAALTRARREGRRIIAVGTTTTRTLESLVPGPDGTIAPAHGSTSLFISPGYEFRLVQGLVTNFHVPRSSLLMLVAAFAGLDAVRQAYATAVAERYRFYSYGDAMAIL